ncbi:MAG: hypothetical protein LBU77_06375 [Clostridiales bacterium]|jgi:hypothetical protein|nr:hypothetical protein [Clostridiales bacterium]
MIGNLSTIRKEGYNALVERLGVAGTIAFLQQFENGSGDYTEERRETLKDETIESIVARIRARNNE